MILDGVGDSIIHFCRVILYAWRSLFVVSLLSDEYLVRVLLSPGICRRLCVFPRDATLLMIHSLHYLLKTIGLPSGEGALTDGSLRRAVQILR